MEWTCSMINKNTGVKVDQLNTNYAYLATCYYFRQIINPYIVKNIWTVKNNLCLHCDAVTNKTNIKDDLGALEVWFNESGIANILSLNRVEGNYLITYDHVNQVFIVHTKGMGSKNGKVILKQGKGGFPYCNLIIQEDAIMFVNTIDQDFEGFTKNEVKRAHK